MPYHVIMILFSCISYQLFRFVFVSLYHNQNQNPKSTIVNDKNVVLTQGFNVVYCIVWFLSPSKIYDNIVQLLLSIQLTPWKMQLTCRSILLGTFVHIIEKISVENSYPTEISYCYTLLIYGCFGLLSICSGYYSKRAYPDLFVYCYLGDYYKTVILLLLSSEPRRP